MLNHHSTMQLHQIQAAVLRREGGPLRIETLELEDPRDDEVLVRLAASGICRTDIDFCDEWWRPPAGRRCTDSPSRPSTPTASSRS